MLKVAGMDCLTMYDSGSSGEAIVGDFAEAAGFIVVNANHQKINVAGGSSITTGYGVYKAILGPLISGKYTEKLMVGLKQITQTIPQYDLSKINEEMKQHHPKFGNTEKLPWKIGGQDIQLLIGIRSAELMPDKILELPNGLMVFRAKIRDKYGSSLIYGGPHETFTRMQEQLGSLNFGSISVMFTELRTAYQYGPVRSSRSFGLLDGIRQAKDEQKISCVDTFQKEHTDNTALTALVPDEYFQLHPTPLETSEREVEQTLNVSRCLRKSPEMIEFIDTPGKTVICMCCGLPDKIILDTSIKGSYHVLEDPEAVAGYVEQVMGIYKMRKPNKPIREMEEEEDLLVYNYRCAQCQECKTCLTADKTKMLSVREEEEDKLIGQSVHWKRESSEMVCTYPWIQEPDSTLRKIWGKDSNESQAFAIFQQQRKKPLYYREGVMAFHKELIDKGYVKRVTDLTDKQQTIIKNSLNTILAKGTNQLSNLYAMLVNFRTYLHVYAFDISKMYNTLRLKDEMLPYSLYIMSPTLDPTEAPEIWCFLTLIYGLVCAGNLAQYAVRYLAKQMRDEYPDAEDALTKWVYMDDGFSGANSEEQRDKIVAEVEAVLPKGGFKIKCITLSGAEPCEKASEDGVSTGLAGYLWMPKHDQLKLGMGELNFNRKIRGYKPPNPNPVTKPDDLEKVIPQKITRRIALGKTAEFWDLLGLVEPLKVKFKLDLKKITVFDWDDKLPNEIVAGWTDNFRIMIEARNLVIRRAVVPEDALNPEEMELLVLSDASVNICATAIYVRFETKQGDFSCHLLTARSRSIDHTVPRNELCGAVLAAETTFSVLKALGGRVSKYTCCVDSGIALAWLKNSGKLLKPFCFNRVRQCHRLIGNECWKYVPGHLNPADLATKGEVKMTDLHPDSVWFTGHSWMKNHLDLSPLKTYEEICGALTPEQREIVDREALVDPQPLLSAERLMSGGQNSCLLVSDERSSENCLQFLVDFVQFGFRKGFRVLTLVIRFVCLLQHKVHTTKELRSTKCKYCKLSLHTFDSSPFKVIEREFLDHHRIDYSPKLEGRVKVAYTSPMDTHNAWDYLSRKCTEEVKNNLPRNRWIHYQEKNGIMFSGGRLSTLDHITVVEDVSLRIGPFYEELHYLNPVALVSSSIVYSLLMHLHTSLNHCGVEKLVNNLLKIFFVERARSLAKRIRKDCVACKIKLRKNYEVMIENQSRLSYTIAPAFYACQIDIISKFKAHDINVRTSRECYVLILVCCLTQAVSLHVMERYDTDSVVSALIRHSGRFGWPKYILPDEGSQLLKLKDLKFSLRDLQQQLWTEQNVILDPCSPKSHWEHGKVESRIGAVRDSLSSMLDFKNSLIGWETIFSTITSVLNSIPITRGNDDRGNLNHEFDLITPYLCLLGHNSNRALEGTFLLENHPSKHLDKVNCSLQAYFSQLTGTFHRLIPAPNKWKSSDPPQEGDVVLFLDNEGFKYDTWKYGRVIETNVDGKKTKIRIGYRNANESKNRETFRHPRNCVCIWKEEDIDFNTTAHFRAVASQYSHEKP